MLQNNDPLHTIKVKSLFLNPEWIFILYLVKKLSLVDIINNSELLKNYILYSSSIYGNNQETSIHPLSDGSGYILFAQSALQNWAYIWMQVILPSVADANCQYVPSIFLYCYGHLKITDSQIFFGGIDSSPNDLHFIKMTLGNTVADWSNKILWSSSPWASFGSEALLSSDGSLIYSFFTFGNPKYIYFITFKTTDGSVVGNRYKSSSQIDSVFGSVLMGNYTGKLYHI